MFRLQLSMEARVAQLLLLLCVASPLLLMSADQQGDSLSTLQRCTLPASPPPSFFVFGASMVDAGTNAVAMPFRSQAEFDPYGSDYFDRPTGRWSNGRTFMDIMTQSLGLELLYPYVQSIGSNFTYGVNFASSGSTAQNTSSTATDSGGLFSLLLQVEQFQEYQNILLSKHQDSKEKLKIRRQLSNSIYFFETAHNDYLKAGLDSDHLQVVKLVMDSMRQAFEGLYNVGAKNFIVMNVIPLGCTPMLLSITTTMEKDEYSCTRAWNEIVKIHNRNLEELLNDMHVNYPMAKWILFDAYNIFLDGFQNPSKYGIKYPFQACCGAGGPYNFNPKVGCVRPNLFENGTYIKAKKCKDPSLHPIWDSIHPVESFSHYIAQGVLDGTHLTPNLSILTRFENVTF